VTNSTGLRAGLARRLISPPEGIFLIGYGDRTKGNMGVHDPLTATALVLASTTTRIAIVALDMLAINEVVVDRVRQRLAPTEVLLCCSHTHSGPIAYAGKGSPRRNRLYIDTLVENITAAVQEAQTAMVPVRLEYSQGQAGIAINRREKMPDGRMEIGRNPQGIVDRSIQMISILRAPPLPVGDGPGEAPRMGVRSDAPVGAFRMEERLATLINYACHGTVLGPDNLLVSADWIGVMRAQVEAELGGLALFLQGAAANLNPDMYWEDQRAFAKVAEQGHSVAGAVLSAVQRKSEPLVGLPLKIERIDAWLPTEAPASSPRPPKNYGKPLLAMAKLPGWMAFLADPLLNQRYPWKPRIEARDGFWSVPMRINALRIGDLAMVTFAAETFTEIGLAVKGNSPAKQTLFVSLTDGCISYLHTASSHPEGGYEVDTAPLAYRYPGRLKAECEGIALQAARNALEKLWRNE
jgi:neutral ceramidase